VLLLPEERASLPRLPLSLSFGLRGVSDSESPDLGGEGSAHAPMRDGTKARRRRLGESAYALDREN